MSNAKQKDRINRNNTAVGERQRLRERTGSSRSKKESTAKEDESDRGPMFRLRGAVKYSALRNCQAAAFR